jgi:uncharacterized NAD(P)/FAD-binding protein YdhS
MHGPQKTDLHRDVVVIGGGLSGALVAVQLGRTAPGIALAVIEKRGLPGRGLAYGTTWPCHLLNVPAGVMSALPDDGSHFLEWVRSNHKPSADASRFLPRELYGRYIGSLFEEAAAANPASLLWISQEAVAVRRVPHGIAVALNDGRELIARAVVVASGNLAPAELDVPGLHSAPDGAHAPQPRRYVASGWADAAYEGLESTRSMLLIGTGLTSVDVAAALHSQGFTGRIHMLSRHGLLPQAHQPAGVWPPFWSEAAPRTVRGLLRLLRAEVRRAAAAGVDWRGVVDALRPHTQPLWQSLSVAEKRRFLRHARTYWDVHRHRLAPQVAETLRELSREGRLSIHAGHVTRYREVADYAEVAFRPRGSHGEETLRVHRVVNCTGPGGDYRRAGSPLLSSLFMQGLARTDALSLGLDVDEHGALLDHQGHPARDLFSLGPPRKGLLWETTALREIRAQAALLAAKLMESLTSEAAAASGDSPRSSGSRAATSPRGSLRYPPQKEV